MFVIMGENISVAVILMFLTGVQSQNSVTLSSESFCAVIGSTVTFPCIYSSRHPVIDKEWYQLKGSEVLNKDPQISARFSVSKEQNNCELTMSDLRVSDSGVYNFRFRTSSSDWISASSGVQLTVTDLQVRIDLEKSPRKMTCSSTCELSRHTVYYWYRNGHNIKLYDASITFYYYNEGSYFCRVSDSSHHSPAVCVINKNSWGGTYVYERVCGLKGSSVDLPCCYKYPAGHTVTTSFWFIQKQDGGEPADIREDEEYQGRVQYRQNSQNDCSMSITDLRESDAQTYRFKFYTNGPGEKYTILPGVSLSVTDLKVAETDTGNGEKILTCSSTCTLPDYPTYIWYKNGEHVPHSYNSLYLYIWTPQAGSYSCAVKGHEEIRSPAVCVFDERSCWSISYSIQTICALIGSSVDIHSYYTFPPQTPEPEPVWYINLRPQDRKLSLTDGRVEFFSNRANMTTLRLKNLTMSDSGKYLLRFKDQTYSSPGVSLSVTGLQVKVGLVTVRRSVDQSVKLTCSSSCTLTNNPTYIWYKNGQRVIDCENASCTVPVGSGAVSYSCGVKGHESFGSPPVYSPKSTRTVLVSSGEIVEGGSVTLSCSSDANPPAITYSWFKQGSAVDALRATGQNNSIFNISSQHSGLYYCTAHNQLGEQNSTLIHLDVLYSPKSTRTVLVSSGEIVEGGSVTLSCSSDANPPAITYSWFKQGSAVDALMATGQNYSIFNISSQHSGLYYCTAHNQLGEQNSTLIHLDVLYPPRSRPSVFMNKSGDSVMLVCISDSNPASTYSWYMKIGIEVKLFGNSTNITIPTSADGVFYCTATNRYGSYNSSEWSSSSGNTATYTASALTGVFFLMLTAAFVWMRRRAAAASSGGQENSGKVASAPVYDNISSMTSQPIRAAFSDDQDEVHYSTVHFSRSHTEEVHLYSTVQLPNSLKQEEEEEVEYATVSQSKARAVRINETTIYSTVQKT